ncbi:MAG: hypothetical protein AB7O32_00185 [Vicinamibacterales bacterium]
MSFQDLAADLVAECTAQLGETVTYRRRVQGTFDGATGKMTPTANSDSECAAIRGPERVAISPSGAPAVEIDWTFAAADLPAARAAGDLVVDAAGVKHVVREFPATESASAAIVVRTRTAA